MAHNNSGASYPLTAMQQGIYLQCSLMQQPDTYLLQHECKSTAKFDPTAFIKVWQMIYSNHQALQLAIGIDESGIPSQRAYACAQLPIEIHDISDSDPQRQQRLIDQFLIEDKLKGFNFNKPPLIRVAAFKQGEAVFTYIVTIHHIITDGWSMIGMLNEFTDLYQDCLNGKSTQANHDSLFLDYAKQYSDRSYDQGFWDTYLSGVVPDTLNQLADKATHTKLSNNVECKTLTHKLDPELHLKLTERLQHENSNMHHLLQTSWAILLAKYLQKDDITFGSVRGCRDQDSYKYLRANGIFINTTPFRIELNQESTIRELLNQTAVLNQQLEPYQSDPLPKIIRSLSLDPEFTLFESLFTYLPYSLESVLMSPNDATTTVNIHHSIPYTLSMNCYEGDNLKLKLSYDALLFSSTLINNIFENFIYLLAQIPQVLDSQLKQLSIVRSDELNFLTTLNQTDKPITETCIHEQFEQQVDKTPDNIAVVFGDRSLTYFQLNERANQLAHYLQQQGVGPEILVAVYLERSFDMIISLLAILKAGGTYLPLDPTYPTARIAYMLEDSQTQFIITDRALSESLPTHTLNCIAIDSLGQTLNVLPKHNLDTTLSASNLAYIIYTSGSTGKPKGVSIEHKSTSCLIDWAINHYSKDELQGVLAGTSICFDLSIFEIFTPLASSGTIVLVNNALDLPALESKKPITLINTVPSVMQELIELDAIPSSVQTINLAGEPLNQSLVNELYQTCNVKRVYDLYGPSEDTTYTTCMLRTIDGINTIGKPIANKQVFILDANVNPIPIGVAGEIHISGLGLARGYLNQPTLTKEKFIDSPFKPGEHLYKTGDLARYLPDGNIEYLGRVDNQVKIRGFRIECGEVTAALTELDTVNRALVIPVELNGNKQLAAYVVYKDKPVSVNELRDALKTCLPDYMIPSYFITLDALPLTPNGKIDRKVLPKPDPGLLKSTNEFVAPDNPLEELVVSIWQDVLNQKRIGVHDNFFQLGGHSLIATQVVSRIRQATDTEVSLKALFESPTIAGLVEHIQQADKTTLPPIEAIAHDKPLPLSFAQERLWFLDQLEGDSATYNMPAAWVIKGNLNSPALEQALAEIQRRHETLRTRFINQDGRSYQVIEATPEFQLFKHDLSNLSADKVNQQVKRMATEEAALAFNLETDLPFRAQLIKLSDEDHVLLLTVHHIASDGWSIGVIMRELATLYNAFSQSEKSPLPPLNIQYVDFAFWQRKVLDEAKLAEDIEYWQQTLAGSDFMLDLPTDLPRPQQQTHNGQHLSFILSSELTQGLEQLARTHNATLFIVLFAAFNVLLSRMSNQDDILIGTPTAGRTHESIENLIGFFVNTLVLRTDLQGNPSFIELIEQVRKNSIDAYVHQAVHFEKLVEVLQVEHDTSRSPIFQVMFVLQNQYEALQKFSDLELSRLENDNKTAKFDLLLNFHIDNKQLHGIFEFNTDLFLPESIERIRDCFTELLEAVVKAPENSLSELNSLPVTQSRLLQQWNQTNKLLPGKCVQQLFEKQVQTTPDQIALAQDQQNFTYHQLNQQANQLAHYLRGRGIGNDDIVAVYLGRCVDTVVCLLGILKAGGAYLPLDPNYPKARLEHMIDDSKAKFIITNQTLNQQLPSIQTPRLLFDSDVHLLEKQAVDNLKQSVSLKNLSYIIYTSGSTGKPKGVAVPHETLANLLAWHIDVCKVPKTVLQFAALSFDISLLECFTAWLSGGKLCMISEEQHQDIASLASIIDQHSINMITFPVVVLQKFSQMHIKHLDKLTSLTDIISSGEQLQISPAITQFFKALPHCRLHNQYGPSESHVVTAYTLDPDPDCWNIHPSIGKPIYNTQIYLLDKFQKSVPIGMVGELYIGGDSLAREYLNQPQMTAEKFIPSPFNSSVRLYKTGDLARYLPDGNIEYLGRSDGQVKLRGFRIECGEIEALLLEHQAISQAVVIIQPYNDDNHLVAYYVGQHKITQQATQQLRDYLSQHLPNYMLPSFFIKLEALPLNPNGKIDKEALPVPDTNLFQLSKPFVAPTDPLEELVAAIWQNVLKHERVGVHDNFFELGGHSLIATQVVSRIRQATDTEVPLKALFESPTVAGLVKQIQQADKTSLPPIEAVSHDKPLPLSFAQERLWFLAQLEGNSSTYNMPEAWLIKGKLNISALEKTLAEIQSRHEALRTRFIDQQGTAYQVIEAEPGFQLTQHDLSDLSTDQAYQQAKEMATEEAALAFDLQTDLPFRAQLIKLADDQHALLLTLHHIASDGWSMGILMRELVALYTAFSQGQTSSLPPLDIQYADFGLWQRKVFDETGLVNELEYWQETLAGSNFVLDLPTDFPRPQQQTYKGRQFTFSLSSELSQNLDEFAKTNNATLFMVLFAAFNILLARFANQDDILIGAPIAGRTHGSIENLIGLFVNTLVLRTDLSDNPSFIELVSQVRQKAINAYTHQDIPFEKLVDVLQPERDTSRSPLFQVMFAFQYQHNEAPEFGELKLTPLRKENTTAKFDLTLSLVQQGSQLKGDFEFNIDLFLPDTIERLRDCFKELLQSIVNTPDSPISQLNILPNDQRQQLADWNQTDKPVINHCIHELFEKQVNKTPNNIAIIFENETLTYHELNERSNQLAHYLKQQGVTSETLIGVYLERSITMVVSLLAILKAGGAYLMMDTHYPAERIAYMLEDSQTQYIITDSTLNHVLSNQTYTIFSLDKLNETLATLPKDNPGIPISPENLIYVIYTSGSTGKPKGVSIQHKALTNHILWMQSVIALSHSDKVLQKTSICFDASVCEFYLPLMQGAQLVMAPVGAEKDFNLLIETLQKQQITHIQFVPSELDLLISYNSFRNCKSLAVIGLGGEKLEHTLITKVKKQLDVKLINLYGPTECTIDACYWEVPDKDLPNTIPIGKPITNMNTYILDANLQAVPIGFQGELYLAGAGLASGYVNSDDRTNEKFIKNPFKQDTKLYKTGDIARYGSDGTIEYLGRLDDQVKIRGFRIECGEIEATLTKLKAVNSAQVLVVEINHDKQLVAYIVYHDKPEDEHTLRDSLRQQLPDYMVPNYFITLDAFPLLPNGKINRKQLAEPKKFTVERQSYTPPQTSLEKAIADVWMDLLAVDKIDRHDNFFDLGGHSLLSLKAIYHIQEQAGVQFKPHDLIFNNLQQLALMFGEIKYPKTPQLNLLPEKIKPAFVNSDDAQLFTHTHYPMTTSANKGILICNPIGHEYQNYHRALNKLAQLLARNGFPVMRFDYYGSGDSSGEFSELTLSQCLRNIDTAVNTFRIESRLEQICLIGARIGSSLALKYAEEYGNIDELVLWSPIETGNQYLEEVLAPGQLQNTYDHPETFSSIEVFGHEFNSKLINEITTLQLQVPEKSISRSLFITDADTTLAEFSHIDVFKSDQANIWQLDPSKVVVPQALLTNICEWLQGDA